MFPKKLVFNAFNSYPSKAFKISFYLNKSLKTHANSLLHFSGVRNPEGSKRSVNEFMGDLAKDKVFYEKCDTGDMQSVRDFASKVQQQFPQIHILINNGEQLSFLLQMKLDQIKLKFQI